MLVNEAKDRIGYKNRLQIEIQYASNRFCKFGFQALCKTVLVLFGDAFLNKIV